MSTLHLPLKKEWFDKIKDGSKLWEYREKTPYWIKRIQGKTFDNIIGTLGYPKKGDDSRRLERPWKGYKTVRRKGKICFAIRIN